MLRALRTFEAVVQLSIAGSCLLAVTGSDPADSFISEPTAVVLLTVPSVVLLTAAAVIQLIVAAVAVLTLPSVVLLTLLHQRSCCCSCSCSASVKGTGSANCCRQLLMQLSAVFLLLLHLESC